MGSTLYQKGLDPKKHIINGNVKDNFWMMGKLGPVDPVQNYTSI